MPHKMLGFVGFNKVKPDAAAAENSTPPPAARASAWGEEKSTNKRKSTAAAGSASPPTKGATAVTSLAEESSVTPGADDAAKEPPLRVFLPIPNDLCGLFLSSWFVPTVKRKFRGWKPFIVAAIVQMGFLAFMCIAMWTADPPKSPCHTPAVMQLIAVFTFAASMLNELNSINLLQLVFFATRLKVPGGPEPDAAGKLRQGSDTLIDIRPTTRRMRMLLALAPLTEFVIEMSTILIGSLYLLVSESIEDLILNAVAVNFVTQLDEILLTAFINKASRERLSKYLFEARWGIEEGDTQMKFASAASKRGELIREWLPLILTILAAGAVAGAQVWGRIFREEDVCEVDMDTLEETCESGCRWVFPDL